MTNKEVREEIEGIEAQALRARELTEYLNKEEKNEI